MADFTVEAKFDGTNWTDISEWAEGIRIRRGRSGDLALVDPGVCTIALDNDDGRFTPTNTQGAYSPNVKPRVEVRVSADSTVLFTGRAQRWTPSWKVDLDAVVTLEAVDGFEELRQAAIPWASNAFIRDNDPDGYWPLGDTGDALRDYSSNGRDAFITDLSDVTVTTGASTIVTGGPGSVQVVNDDTGDQPVVISGPPQSWSGASNDITFSMWVRWDELGSAPTMTFAEVRNPQESSDNWDGWSWHINSTGATSGKMILVIMNGGAQDDFESSDLTWSADTDYHVAFHWDVSAQTITFYRDGVAVGSGTVTAVPGSGINRLAMCRPSSTDPSTVRFAEVALWPSDQSALMSDLHSSGTGFPSDSPNDRITRVLDWAGWPAGDRDLDTGTTPLAGITGGGTALSEAQDAAAADGGVFYIAKNGDAAFQGRHSRWEVAGNNTVQFTFDDDGTDTPYEQIGWRYDTTLLHNRVVINSNTQGTSDGVSQDSTSIGTYGKRELSISTISNNSADNAQRADWEVARRRDPQLRLERIGGHVGDSDEQTTFRDVELQDLVEAFRRPGSGQDDLDVKLRVSAVEHSVTNAGRRWDGMLELTEAETDLPALYDDTRYSYDADGTGSDRHSYYGY